MLTNGIKNNREYNLSFISNSSIEQLKIVLQLYFKRTFQSNDKSIRFSGFFITNTEFEIRSKWEMIFRSKPYKSRPFVYGTLSPIDNETTKVQLKVRHKVFKPEIVFLLILPIYLIISGLFGDYNINTVIFGVVALLFLIGFYFIAIIISYNNVISELEVELKLIQIQDKK